MVADYGVYSSLYTFNPYDTYEFIDILVQYICMINTAGTCMYLDSPMPVIYNPYKAGRFGTIHFRGKGSATTAMYIVHLEYIVLNCESNGIENASSAENPR